jgi:hypothetical protein
MGAAGNGERTKEVIRRMNRYVAKQMDRETKTRFK